MVQGMSRSEQKRGSYSKKMLPMLKPEPKSWMNIAVFCILYNTNAPDSVQLQVCTCFIWKMINIAV